MTERKYNFNPGPAVLPQSVLEQAQEEMLDWQESGMSVMEMSHRGKHFESIIHKAESDLRTLLNLSVDYEVLFLQGGGHLQFSMVPLNFCSALQPADYVLTGTWGKTAYNEAVKLGNARIAYSGENSNFKSIPKQNQLDFNLRTPYVHFTSNETIQGVQWPSEPVIPEKIPLIADCSSDFLSRPIDINKYSLIYATAQKNAGPAGVTLVIARKDMLNTLPENTTNTIPTILNYKLMAEKKSLLNTPPCFSIYIVGLVLQWLNEQGGLEAIDKENQKKAKIVYEVIDSSGGYYKGHAQPDSRSNVNVTFRLPNENQEKNFVEESEKAGFIGLKGHRSVGGLRASLYNAQSIQAVHALIEFMKEFQRKNG